MEDESQPFTGYGNQCNISIGNTVTPVESNLTAFCEIDT